ncbi:cys/Met metabolism PLP-dependent enzyme family protein, partial [Vibrio parahaemolyticus V-223/04]
SMRFS